MRNLLVTLAVLFSASLADSPTNTFYSGMEHFFADYTCNGKCFMYITPSYPQAGNYQSVQETTTVGCKEGKWCLSAYITHRYGSSNCSDPVDSCGRERSYPTIQCNKMPGNFQKNIFSGMTFIRFWLWTNVNPYNFPGHSGWFSPFTVTYDSSVAADSVVTLTIGIDNYLALEHVPTFDRSVRIFQADSTTDPTGSLRFPKSQWVRVDMLYAPNPTTGYAKVWQNGKLVSYANVYRRAYAAFFHFGLYCSPNAGPPGDSVVVKNDGVMIQQVPSEAAAISAYRPDLPPRGP